MSHLSVNPQQPQFYSGFYWPVSALTPQQFHPKVIATQLPRPSRLRQRGTLKYAGLRSYSRYL